MAEKMRLGELLIEAGLIDNIQLQSALAHQKKWGTRIGASLIELNLISENNLASLLEKQLNTRCVTIMDKAIDPEAVNAIDPEIARKYEVFPLDLKGKALVVATANPLDLKMLDDLSFRLGKMIRPLLALDSEIKRAISFYYEHVQTPSPAASAPMAPAEERTIAFEPSAPKKELTTKAVVDALVSVLEKKGLLARAEIFEELKKRNIG